MNGFSDRDAELGVGHLLGVRWFRLNHGGLRGAWDFWEPGENAAACKNTHGLTDAHGPVPAPECGCGYWAYWRLGNDPKAGHPAVAGVIKGYGRVIEGSAGFRCSQATIVALCPVTVPSAVSLEPSAVSLEEAAQMEDTYHVPVYTTVAGMLAMHPAPASQPLLLAPFEPPAQPPRPTGDKRGGISHGESYLDYARRIGLAPPRGKAWPDEVPPVRRPPASGAQAQEWLHSRREGWAKPAGTPPLPPTIIGGGGGSTTGPGGAGVAAGSNGGGGRGSTGGGGSSTGAVGGGGRGSTGGGGGGGGSSTGGGGGGGGSSTGAVGGNGRGAFAASDEAAQAVQSFVRALRGE